MSRDIVEWGTKYRSQFQTKLPENVSNLEANIGKYETFSGDWVWLCEHHNCILLYHTVDSSIRS